MPLQRISDLTAGSPPYSGAALVEVSVPTGASPPYVSRSAQISDLPYLTSSIAASTYAPLASPALTGNPTAPTPAAADSDTSIATTAFVSAAITAAPNKLITLSGDIAGSGTAAIVATLPAVNASVGTFQGLTVNGKGQVTAAANQSYLTSSGVSGMSAGQIPIAATATTITSSGNLSGAVTTSGSLATTLANNAVATAHITNANVTYAKIQNVAANRLLGNSTGSAAAPAEIALPLVVANGGTGASTLPLTTGGASMGLAGTFLQTNGVVAGSATAASGTVGTWGGGSVVAMGAGAEADLTMSRCTGTLASPTAVATGAVLGGVLWYGYAATAYANTAGVVAATSDTFTASAQGTLLQFYATPTGTTSLGVKMTLQSGLQIGVPTGGDKGAGTLNAVTVYGNNVVLTSDARLKTDIEPLPPCLALVEAVEPKTYRWAVPDEFPERPNGEGRLSREEMAPAGFYEASNRGFLAQDVAAVLGGADDAVDLGGMVAVLWRAVQELSAKLVALEGRPA